MEFELHTPNPPLDRYVETLWYQRIPLYAAREIILPTQHIELIINFGEPHKVFADKNLTDFTWHVESWLAGLQTRCLFIESTTSYMIGARLKPGGAAALFDKDIQQLTDQVTPLERLLRDQQAAELRQSLRTAPDGAARFDRLEAFLLAQLNRERPGLDLALRAAKAILDTQGDLNLRELSEALAVSQKHLIQIFTPLIGLKPKQFARVVRFSGMLPALGDKTAPDWAILARQAGYHDQSHFNREFQAFAGLSPTQYVQMRQGVEQPDIDFDDDDSTTRFVPLS